MCRRFLIFVLVVFPAMAKAALSGSSLLKVQVTTGQSHGQTIGEFTTQLSDPISPKMLDEVDSLAQAERDLFFTLIRRGFQFEESMDYVKNRSPAGARIRDFLLGFGAMGKHSVVATPGLRLKLSYVLVHFEMDSSENPTEIDYLDRARFRSFPISREQYDYMYGLKPHMLDYLGNLIRQTYNEKKGSKGRSRVTRDPVTEGMGKYLKAVLHSKLKEKVLNPSPIFQKLDRDPGGKYGSSFSPLLVEILFENMEDPANENWSEYAVEGVVSSMAVFFEVGSETRSDGSLEKHAERISEPEENMDTAELAQIRSLAREAIQLLVQETNALERKWLKEYLMGDGSEEDDAFELKPSEREFLSGIMDKLKSAEKGSGDPNEGYEIIDEGADYVDWKLVAWERLDGSRGIGLSGQVGGKTYLFPDATSSEPLVIEPKDNVTLTIVQSDSPQGLSVDATKVFTNAKTNANAWLARTRQEARASQSRQLERNGIDPKRPK